MSSQDAQSDKPHGPRNSTIRRERLWLEMMDLHYYTARELATSAGLTVRRIQQGVRRARLMRVELASIWEIEWIANHGNPFKNSCDVHGGPDQEFPRYVPKGCLNCLKSGLDHLIHRPLAPPKERDGAGTKYDGPPLTREKQTASR